MESYEIIWKTALPELEKTISGIAYDTYVSIAIPVDIVAGRLVLCTPSAIFKNTLEGNLRERVCDALRKSGSEVTDFTVMVAKSKEEYLKMVAEEEVDLYEAQSSPINPKFTFDSFVVGSSNEMIYAAAKAVAERPGEAYNPLYIYGGTGLGKTHILMAIANYLKKNNRSLRVLYATCEQFTNQLIESIGKGKGSAADFRSRYRNVDVLLIDDVQFLSKKQQTQSEFFHTFNELVLQNKQIVLTSDCSPSEIELLEDRLRTRFESGLLADVQQPDLETRIAILRKKSEEQKCLIDIKVLTYIAEKSSSDIRTLIGKLTKVIFASKLHERPITIDLVNDALKESAGERQEELQADDIINCVCSFYKVSKADVIGKKKNKEFVEPRQVCMYLISDMMNLPLAAVGELIGGRDHATVIYGRDKIADQMQLDNKLKTEINDLKKMLLKE